jgi:hypothetical protein
MQEYHLQKQYGISKADVEQMMEAQDGRCAICGTDRPNGRNSKLHVDHCHVTGEVRGMLCHGCNMAIGYLKDDPALALAAACYLEAAA